MKSSVFSRILSRSGARICAREEADPIFPVPPWGEDAPLAIVSGTWPGHGTLTSVQSEDKDRLFARLAASGLIGPFWADPAPAIGPFARIVVMPGRKGVCVSVLATLAREMQPRETLLYFTHAPDAAVLEEVEASGWRYLVGPYAPRSLLALSSEIHVFQPGALAIQGLVQGSRVRLRSETGARALDAGEAYLFLTEGLTCISPYYGQVSDLHACLDCLETWKRQRARLAGIAVCVGMSWWKRRRILQFFSDDRRPVFRRTARVAVEAARRREGGIAVWSARVPRGLGKQAQKAGVGIALVEDGFLRSVGLGSDLLPPASVVLDRKGIYFDPSRPSDLEEILGRTEFDEALLVRASALRARLVASRITKYGIECAAALLPDRMAGQRRILVPGQVADDLSITLGTAFAGEAQVRTNEALLQEVRRRNPDAFIVFRPHPDVDAGHRKGALPDETVVRHADIVARGGSIADLIAQVDEVHTMTSLAGFEGLMRGCRVCTYGAPFYAGWGLTEDFGAPPERRKRVLTLDQLVAGTLLLYPLYLDPVSSLPCEAELLVERLLDETLWHPGPVMRLRQFQGRLRRKLGRYGVSSPWKN